MTIRTALTAAFMVVALVLLFILVVEAKEIILLLEQINPTDVIPEVG